MPEKTHFGGRKFSCRKKFTSCSWRIKHFKSHHPDHIQVENQQNLTVRTMPQHVESAHSHDFSANNDLVDDIDAFPSFVHIEIISNWDFQPQ
jgi:hypothetical protein